MPAGATVLAATLVALLSQGCGGLPGSEPETTAEATVTSTPASPGQPPASTPVDTGDGLAWVPFGPSDSNSPDGTGWYRNLELKDCAGLQNNGNGTPKDPLILALASVCLAVKGDQAQWAVAQQFAQLPRVRPTECIQQAAEDLLARALAWHAGHPGQTPVTSEPQAGEYACPFGITLVRTQDEEGTYNGPPQGPVTGGTRVGIVGDRLFEVTAVYIGENLGTEMETAFISVDPNKSPAGGVSVLTPEAIQPGPVDIRVVTKFGEVTKAAGFTYLPTTSPSAPSTPDTAPPSSPPSTPPSSPDVGTPSPESS